MTTANPYASFTTSESFETQGIWIEEPAFRVKVARAGGKNKAYEKIIDKLFRKHRRSIKMGNISEDVAGPLLAEAFVQTVIKGWEVNTGEVDTKTNETIWKPGIHDPETGEVVSVTPDAIKATLLHPKFGKDLFGYLREQANNSALFLEDVAEVDTKN